MKKPPCGGFLLLALGYWLLANESLPHHHLTIMLGKTDRQSILRAL
ncbi:MAG: hypothetical protein ACJASB_000804 [Shewanella psychromarinicola]|jgi:hypothetical protein